MLISHDFSLDSRISGHQRSRRRRAYLASIARYMNIVRTFVRSDVCRVLAQHHHATIPPRGALTI